MSNGQNVPPPPQQTAPIVSHDISSGREITYFNPATGKPAGTTTAGGTFYSVQGIEGDVFFRTPEEARTFAASKGISAGQPVGVSDVPSSQYWQQKTAREEAAKSAYGGVRTAAALGEVGKPVAGSQLEAKKAYLERGTGYWASEEQFKQATESVGKYTPVSAKGEIVSKPVDELKTLQNLGFSTEGLRGSYDPTTGRLTTVTYPIETQKITLPPTPRETTEAFMKRMEGEGPMPIKAPYGTDIFGYPRQAPGRIIYPGQEESIPMKIFSGAKTISSVGLGMGFGEAFTTSSMIRGAKLIQPGDVAAITKTIKSFAPKIPSGLREFVGAEEAVFPRRVATKQMLEPPKPITETKQEVRVVDLSKELVMPGTQTQVQMVRTRTAAMQYVKPSMVSQSKMALAEERTRLYVLELEARQALEAEARPSLLPLLGGVYATKLIQRQQQVLKTPQISVTQQQAIQQTRQIQRAFQISPQVSVSRTVTPQIERAVSVTPQISITEQVMEAPTVPKEISRGFEPPRLKEPEITKPIALPFPDFQVYPTRKKGKKKAKGERILKLYPIGLPSNILGSLRTETPKRSKKHKSKKSKK